MPEGMMGRGGLLGGALLSAFVVTPTLAHAQSAYPSFEQVFEAFEPQAHCLAFGATDRRFVAPAKDAPIAEIGEALRQASETINADCQEYGLRASKALAANPAYSEHAAYTADFGQAVARIHAELDLRPLVITDEGGERAIVWFHDAVSKLRQSYLHCLERGLELATVEQMDTRSEALAFARDVDGECVEERREVLEALSVEIDDFASDDWPESETSESRGLRERLQDWRRLVIAYHAGLKGAHPLKAVYMQSLPDPSRY